MAAEEEEEEGRRRVGRLHEDRWGRSSHQSSGSGMCRSIQREHAREILTGRAEEMARRGWKLTAGGGGIGEEEGR